MALSTVQAIIVLVNVMFGCGVLFIPAAFSAMGWRLSSITLAVMAVVMGVCVKIVFQLCKWVEDGHKFEETKDRPQKTLLLQTCNYSKLNKTEPLVINVITESNLNSQNNTKNSFESKNLTNSTANIQNKVPFSDEPTQSAQQMNFFGMLMRISPFLAYLMSFSLIFSSFASFYIYIQMMTKTLEQFFPILSILQ